MPYIHINLQLMRVMYARHMRKLCMHLRCAAGELHGCAPGVLDAHGGVGGVQRVHLVPPAEGQAGRQGALALRLSEPLVVPKAR